MAKFDHKKIDKKWQKFWADNETHKTQDDAKKPKYYILDMFPYPSGVGLHVGHPKGYIATDIMARMKMMQGFNVLHPMGWDAFGLPAENYAIKNKVHPREAVEKNVEVFKEQLHRIGFTYDWDREVNTTDPSYYKWTQWAFIKMFEKGLAYESTEPIIWCPSCKTGLAMEDLEGGKCERCGSEVEKKPLRQWVLKITDYADRLLSDLDTLDKWPEPIKEMQRNWIGKSEGAEIDFNVQTPMTKQTNLKIKVFTTRPDTLFGATFMVLAPEHPLVEKITVEKQKKEVEKYVKQAAAKSDLERAELQKDKSGIFTGAYAINPANKKEIPIWVADYVLMNYGTGAIMAVPAHDERDYDFAKKYDIEIVEVIKGGDIKKEAYTDSENGEMVNSDQFNGMEVKACVKEIVELLNKDKLGKPAVNYKLQDWVFSRQRYWGEPIPIIHCEKCGAVPVPEKDLPVELPDVKSYEPTGTGESPLAAIEEWVNVKCPKCGGTGKRETNTMPQWAGSNWYYLRYMDPHNDKALVDKKIEKYWSPVDFYVGGAEHATRHLIYSRFWHKFLFDIGVVSNEEPFDRFQNVGLIMAEDGRKMSKRWNNVVNPDEVIDEYGADAFRTYEMFMGPFDQAVTWDANGLRGVRKFLDKVEAVKVKDDKEVNKEVITLLHKTIKKVSEDINSMDFNTAISQMMIFVNKVSAEGCSNQTQKSFLQLLSPFAPHLAEELWSKLGEKESIFLSAWPKFDEKLIVDEEIEMPIQINGKVRDKLMVPTDISDDELEKLALASEKVQKFLDGAKPKKVIYVKGRLLSIVV